MISDFAKMDYPPQLHIGFQAIHAFKAKHGSFPGPHNAEHAAEVLASAKEIAAKDKEPVVCLFCNLNNNLYGEVLTLPYSDFVR